MHRNSTPPTVRGQARPAGFQPEPDHGRLETPIPVWVSRLVGEPIPGRTRADGTAVKFTHTHVQLLRTVEAMSHWGDVGCWASNRRLGEMTGVCERRAKQIIRDCIQMGLLKDRGLRVVRTRETDICRRVLETSWCVRAPRRPKNGASEGGNVLPLRGGNGLPPRETQEKREHKPRAVPHKSRDNFRSSVPMDDETDLLGNPATTQVRTPPDIQECDLVAADRLRAVVLKRRGRVAAWSRQRWGDEFRKLRESLTNPIPRLTYALDWYAQNIGKEYVPLALSASGFRAKFDQIEEAMKREQKRRPTTKEVSPSATRIAKRLMAKTWPKGCEDQLPAVAQASLDAFAAFREKLDGLLTRSLGRAFSPELRLAKRLLLGDLSDPSHFVEGWLGRVYDRLRGWKGWSGSLGDWVWRPDREEFRADGRGWAKRFCGDPDVWDQLMKAVGDV